MPVDHFGEETAARYDATTGAFAPDVVAATVEFLAGLADGGAALEFAVGTGRVALPLAQRGVPVSGIDLSEAMVARLREKPGADAVRVSIGDMATTRLEGRFALVYLVFNTIMNLTSQEEQVACFENAAAQLEPGGCFVVEVGVPALQRLPPGERFRVFHHSERAAGIDEYDLVTQALTGHYWSTERGYRTVPFRYVWPSELDLMARIAGLRLRERWADWRREPFTAESTRHISVWEKPGRRRPASALSRSDTGTGLSEPPEALA